MSAAQNHDVRIDIDRLVVLVNAERQYSVWPEGLPVPEGWVQAAEPASRADSLAYVEAHWRDMRPLTLRTAMDGEADPA
jgi:MbtH protein